MPVDLIVLAAVAIFVLLRLYNVLGQDIGQDKPSPPRDATFDAQSKVIELTPRQLERVVVEAEAEQEEAQDGMPDDIKEGVMAIRKEDKGFRLSTFMEGANMAFDMVLEAFAKGDADTLKQLLSKELYTDFATELKARATKDEYEETTLITIVESEALKVERNNKHAVITVRFLSEQIQVTRTKDGGTVKDSASAIEQVEDEWVFTRELRSTNPNWTIIAT